ncbi:unnamed protein product [Caenorhabditis brenneri]
MLRSIILVLVVLAISTHGYSCNNQTNIIDPPADLSQPQYYPSNWNGELPIPVVDNYQYCFLTVSIPTGYYAQVTFYRNISFEGGTYVLYSNNQLTRITNDVTQPFYFTFPYFKVSLQTDNHHDSPQFAFKIVYTQYHQVQKNIIPISQGQPPVAVLANDKLTVFSGVANSFMGLMAFSLPDDSQNYLLRQSVVFGGDSFNSDFIGTLDFISHSRQPITTYGNKIAVYTFGLSNIFNNTPLFMGQNGQDVRKYNKYRGANCPSTGNCTVFLDGTWGSSLTVTDYNGSEFIKGFNSFSDEGTINVYENMVSNTTRIASLTSANYLQQLPLEVKGAMKFYEINGYGKYEMVVTRDVSRASRISH